MEKTGLEHITDKNLDVLINAAIKENMKEQFVKFLQEKQNRYVETDSFQEKTI